MIYGSDRSRMFEAKRGVEDKERGPRVKTVMTRCIHCTRCIRFASEVAGVGDRGTSGRGRDTEVGTYIHKRRQTEVSGNLIDLCPVGALTAKPTAFMTRPWERETTDTVDVLDGMGSSVRAQTRGLERFRIQPRENDDINQLWIGDKSRFSIDGLTHQRVTTAYVRSVQGLKPVNREEAVKRRDTRLQTSSAVDRVVNSSLSTEQRVSATSRAQRLEARGTRVTRHVVGTGSQPTSTSAVHVDVAELGNLKRVSDADVVVLVGFNPRRESPVRNLRLRESFLRDRVQVRTRGRSSASGETTHGLTYPTVNRGRSLDARGSRRDGDHPASDIRFSAQRPRRRRGPSALGRHDGAARRQARRRRAHRLGTYGAASSGSNVLFRVSDTANRSTAHSRGWHALTPMTPSSTRRRVGVQAADFMESGRALPNVTHHQAMRSRVTHGDDWINSSDVIVPLRSAYEEDGHYTNTEGRVQQHRASVSAQGIYDSSAPAPVCDLVMRSASMSSTPVMQAAQASTHASSVTRGRGPSGLGATRATPVIPAIHDYYREGHVLARVSPTMAKSSQSFSARTNFLA